MAKKIVMENLPVKAPATRAIWTGRVISMLCIAFLLFDAIGKIVRESHSIKGSAELGWLEQSVQGIGITLLVCTILYSIPRTAVLGAVLVTAYLGGAVAIMARVSAPFIFPVVFGVLVWAGLFLREPRVRRIFPLNR